MRKILYTSNLPFRNLLKEDKDIEKFEKWKDFRKQWDTDEELIVILPIMTFDLIGFDIRFSFREFGRHDNVRFLLIGTTKQINFALSQNGVFLGNLIEELILPHDFDSLEYAILKKIKRLETQTKGK